MKVGVLTFHYSDNFGALLQCASLCQSIRELGHKAEVINYCPPVRTSIPWFRHWGFRSKTPIQNIRSRIASLRAQPRMHRACDRFRDAFFQASPRCTTIDALIPILDNYDAIVVGSDQVWNCKFSSVTPVYFLAGVPYRGRKISYAVSCGSKRLALSNTPPGTGEALRAFDFISVRDADTASYVHEISGREAREVCDPTLLCTLPQQEKSRYAELLSSDYILSYLWGKEIAGGHKEALAHIRARHGQLKVLAVAPTSFLYSRHAYADHVLLDAGPLDWTQLIANARFVYTNSFHGTLFSVKYQRPFLSYCNEQYREHRLLDFAQKLDLQPWLVSSIANAETQGAFSTQPNYSLVLARLGHIKRQSIAFLSEALS